MISFMWLNSYRGIATARKIIRVLFTKTNEDRFFRRVLAWIPLFVKGRFKGRCRRPKVVWPQSRMNRRMATPCSSTDSNMTG